MGAIKCYSKEEIEKNMLISFTDADGTRQRLSPMQTINPDLEIGKVNDNGGFFEVEIVDEGQEIVQLLGVDKRSGRLILLN